MPPTIQAQQVSSDLCTKNVVLRRIEGVFCFSWSLRGVSVSYNSALLSRFLHFLRPNLVLILAACRQSYNWFEYWDRVWWWPQLAPVWGGRIMRASYLCTKNVVLRRIEEVLYFSWSLRGVSVSYNSALLSRFLHFLRRNLVLILAACRQSLQLVWILRPCLMATTAGSRLRW